MVTTTVPRWIVTYEYFCFLYQEGNFKKHTYSQITNTWTHEHMKHYDYDHKTNSINKWYGYE